MQHTEAVEPVHEATTSSPADDFVFNLARILTRFDDGDVALATIQKLIDKPTVGGKLSAATLRRNPIWDPIRKDPRFEEAITTFATKESN